MGLQRIFSTTTVIVGLFISVDYGLCDEFRCRGFERERRTDDAGPWNWQVHSIWATVYVAGLALFAAYYTFLDRFMIPLEVVSTLNRYMGIKNCCIGIEAGIYASQLEYFFSYLI